MRGCVVLEPVVERHGADIANIVHDHAPADIDADMPIDATEIGMGVGWDGNDHANLELTKVGAAAPLPEHIAGVALWIPETRTGEDLADPHSAKSASRARGDSGSLYDSSLEIGRRFLLGLVECPGVIIELPARRADVCPAGGHCARGVKPVPQAIDQDPAGAHGAIIRVEIVPSPVEVEPSLSQGSILIDVQPGVVPPYPTRCKLVRIAVLVDKAIPR